MHMATRREKVVAAGALRRDNGRGSCRIAGRADTGMYQYERLNTGGVAAWRCRESAGFGLADGEWDDVQSPRMALIRRESRLWYGVSGGFTNAHTGRGWGIRGGGVVMKELKVIEGLRLCNWLSRGHICSVEATVSTVVRVMY